jgi:hypothetical protein
MISFDIFWEKIVGTGEKSGCWLSIEGNLAGANEAVNPNLYLDDKRGQGSR